MYRALRGWDKPTGLPTAGRLRELGLDDIAADLKVRDLLR
jgi:aldehyde:ferredoxin oxidoreductase